MSASDRAFGALVAVAGAIGACVAVPLLLTFFPSAVERIVRGSNDAVAFCAGVLTSVHTELPPLGALALGLTAIALAPLSVRTLRSCRPHARPVRPAALEIRGRLARAASRVGISDRVVCLDDRARYAYCAGLRFPRVHVSLGAVRCLRNKELEAVLWHERHHLRRRDPLRSMIARALGSIFLAAPLIPELVARFEIARELDADHAALAAQGTPHGLAGALLALDERTPQFSTLAMSGWSLSSVRIDQLAGASSNELLPRASSRAVLTTSAILAVAMMLAMGQAARAHLLPAGLLPEEPGAVAHVCPLPIRGPLL